MDGADLGAAKEPRTLALLLVGYMIATLVGSRRVRRGGVARERRALQRSSRARSRASRRSSCGRSSPRSGRRPTVGAHGAPALYGAGLRTDPALPVGGGAFVLTTLATVVFDGWSQTDRFGGFQQWFWERWSFLAHHVDVLQTLSMVAVVAIFVSAYLLITRATRRRSR